MTNAENILKPMLNLFSKSGLLLALILVSLAGSTAKGQALPRSGTLFGANV